MKLVTQPRKMTGANGTRGHLTIAFDTWVLMSRFRNNGIYVYARNLLGHFRQMASEASIEVRPLVSSAVSSDANQFGTRPGFRPYDTNLLRSGRVWRHGGACLSARISNADLLFCPSGNTLPIRGLIPVVTTIHDIIPVVLPTIHKASALRREYSMAAKLSRTVITDSRHSKQDLVNIFGLPESKVHVVHLACDRATFNDAATESTRRQNLLHRLGLDRPYILHHGRIHERKNVKRLIEAYAIVLSRKRNFDVDLVLVGELDSGHEEIVAAAKRCQAPARVIFTGPQTDPDLAILLKSATLAVIPSLYEGFCLPLLEAMACGTPTISSNASCLPEISGGVLRYFDPASLDEMACCIEEVLESDALRASLSLKGKERAGFFSWERCAAETLAILKTAAAN